MKIRDSRTLTQHVPLVIVGLLGGLVASGLLLVMSSGPRGAPIELAEPDDLRVHVAGEVIRPGVYELPFGSIVEDAIEAAGGLGQNASSERINLAGGLEDGQQVFVPIAGSSDGAGPLTAVDPIAPSARLPINTASVAELERLPGIGPVLAQRILEYRELHGPFQRPEDLLEVEGIGPAKLEGLSEYILVP